MVQKLKMLILSLTLLFSFAAPVLVVGTASAEVNQNQINGALCNGANINVDTNSDLPNGKDTCAPKDQGPSLTSIIKKIINVLSLLVGAIAVIMIIVGGFRYVTSAGSESGVSSAKKTIMYALIGLVIVALAQVVVHFVLNNIT